MYIRTENLLDKPEPGVERGSTFNIPRFLAHKICI